MYLIYRINKFSEAERLDRWLTCSEFYAEREGLDFYFQEENIDALEMELTPLFNQLGFEGYFESEE